MPVEPTSEFDRRTVLAAAMGVTASAILPFPAGFGSDRHDSGIGFGMVTYLWGRDLALTPLLQACSVSGVSGVELRSTHAHGVEPSLDQRQREEVRGLITESGVKLVGLGSDERFDSPDPATLRSAIDATKSFLKLSHDLGGGGVKVKPDRFHEGVPRERTIEQIAASLREVGKYASDLDQEVRLEVHGGCSEPAVIRRIIEEADHPSVRVCWNCNARDLDAPGLEDNFRLLRPFFGDTLHVRELDSSDYPYRHLTRLLVESDWKGWMLLEAHSSPGPVEQRADDLRAQRLLHLEMLADAGRTREPRPLRIRTRRIESGIEVLAGEALLAATHLTPKGPILFPVNVPGAGCIVRRHPMATHPGESTDHPHHRSLWLAHGDVDGHDFWHDPDARVHLVSEKVLPSDEDSAVIEWNAEWRVGDDVVLVERRLMTFRATNGSGHVEFDITLAPPTGTVTFGDTKEGFFAIRLAPSLKVDGGPSARGRLENAEGSADRSAWGKRSSTMTIEGPLDGRLVRILLTDHPDNPRHPTWWHARTYGLVAANPFGIRAFEGGDSESGAMTVSADHPLRLRYGLDCHAF